MTNSIRNKLYELQDREYKAFQQKLIPNINPDTVIGVRTPALRKLAKELKSQKNINNFLSDLPHKYYEEKNLHAFLIEQITDFDKCIEALECFLPFVDNWGTCDSMRPKAFKKDCQKLLPYINKWLNSNHTYTVRYGILMLMTYFLDNDFKDEYLERVSTIKSDEYYINMMISWYFATALYKQWSATVPFIEQNRLPEWIHNKTIQKAVESYRITSKQKEYLRKLKVRSQDLRLSRRLE